MAKIPSYKNVKWEKTGGSLVQFKKKNDSFIGVYKGSRVTSTKFGKQTVLKFENEAGKEVEMFASKVLEQIAEFKKGTLVKIVFIGEGGKGKNKYKNFDIYKG